MHAKITESVGWEIIFKGGYCFVISAKKIGYMESSEWLYLFNPPLFLQLLES